MSHEHRSKPVWEKPAMILLDGFSKVRGNGYEPNCVIGSTVKNVDGYWQCANGVDTGMPGGCVEGASTLNHECVDGGNTTKASGHNCVAGGGFHG